MFDTPAATGAAPAKGRRLARMVVKLIVIGGLVGFVYLVGLLRHSPGSYRQLKAGGTAAFPGLVTKANATSVSIKTTDGTKTIAVKKDTPYALFPKDYQTLIPIGLPSSASDIVVGTTEASVSAQLPYLKQPQALRVNLVRDDVLTGKVIELSGSALKFKGFTAAGSKEETRTIASNATYLKLGTDGTTSPAVAGDVKADMGLYAFLSGPASDANAQIVRLIVADFSTPSSN